MCVCVCVSLSISLFLSEYHAVYAGMLAICQLYTVLHSQISPTARKWQVTSGCPSTPHARLVLGGAGACSNQLHVAEICVQSEEY